MTSPLLMDRRPAAREDVVAAHHLRPDSRGGGGMTPYRHVPLRVLVAGGGVAVLEACLALDALAVHGRR